MPTDNASQEAKEARRWQKELNLSHKRDRDWERESEKIVKRFRGEEKKRNRYNVLWSNTELLRPAIYNSKPTPDVRRRFADADPIGKAVCEVLERSLSIFVDGDAFDDSITNDVIDGLLCGRGVSRIRYVAKITPVSTDDEEDADDKSLDTEATDDEPNDQPDLDRTESEEDSEGDDAPDEQVEEETVEIEHVDWKDFRHGFGRVWAEVTWVSFRHKLTRAEGEEKFDESCLSKIEFTTPVADENKRPGDQVGETEKVAEFWEVWDKSGKKVFFLHDSCEFLLFPKDNPNGEPPIEFDDFFPNPRPLMIVENTGSLLPTPPFRLYEDQASALDMISGRIDKIVRSMRLRGIYDSRITEMADLLSSDDNEMVPVQNAQAWADGGLDKAISWVPVEKNAEILQSLYEARERQKAIIDELTGISDIMRGATDPNETMGAQQLKSTFGSIRLQRMQGEVKRYARDLIRLAAATMSQKFSSETFTDMTELKFPTQQDKMLLQHIFAQRAQAQAMQAMPAPPGMMQHPGMPPGSPPGPQQPGMPAPMQGSPMGSMQPPQPPQPPIPGVDPGMMNLPTWEDILGVMRGSKRRQYKIDVETDSTVAGTLSSDMQGLSQVLTAISQSMQELAPMVEQGVLPVDAAKEIILTVIRRARMGMAVEDAFDKLQAPKPKPDPEAAKAQAQAQGEAQKAQAQAQADMAKTQAQSQADMALENMKQQGEKQRMLMEEQFKSQREQFLEQQKSQRDENDARFDAMVKIIVATIGASKQADPVVTPIAEQTIAGSHGSPAAPAVQ